MLKHPRTINFGKGITIPSEIVQKFPEEVSIIVEKTKKSLNKDIEEYATQKGLYVLNIEYSLIENPNVISGELELMVKAIVEVRRGKDEL